MSHTAHGRHRASAPPRRSRRRPLLVIGLLVLIVGIGADAVLLWPDDTSPPDASISSRPSISTSDSAPSPSAATAIVGSTRGVTVDGDTVTIEEVSTVVDGAAVRAIPTDLIPLGLQLIDASIVTPDGRTKSFDSPITIDASGSLTVRSRYRLTECPDIVPTLWPSPADFPGATRSYLRLDGPLHTASAICPRMNSAAERLSGLSGTAIDGSPALVRLTWGGPQPLTIKAIGAASGVAAIVANPDCDASCVATLPPGGTAELQLQPVDPCPPATDSNRLTLVVMRDDASSTIALDVSGLADAVCS
ncbi:MAG: hypothetical protein LH630_09410 [Actinomycetia bacterium]|nr:hypothetical protein [Actinomycetes bacterium]